MYLRGMLSDLGRVFRESLAAFHAELGRCEPEDEVASLLSAMRRELVEARAAIPGYRKAVEAAEASLRGERELIVQCERREAAARRIGDSETARIAGEFAGKHRARAQVLEQKVRASRAELDLRSGEAEDMMKRFRDAEASRFGLVAELRTARTRARMASLLDDDEPPAAAPSPAEVDDRLRELKRRMKRG